MVIAWNKETEDRYTATWQGNALTLLRCNRCWRVTIQHTADGQIFNPANRWRDLALAMEDIDAKALRALMTVAHPVARQHPPVERVIHHSRNGHSGRVRQVRQ